MIQQDNQMMLMALPAPRWLPLCCGLQRFVHRLCCRWHGVLVELDRTPAHIARAAEVAPFATLQCWVQQGNTHDPLLFAGTLQPMLCCVNAYTACE